jgi:hypothetical protein
MPVAKVPVAPRLMLEPLAEPRRSNEVAAETVVPPTVFCTVNVPDEVFSTVISPELACVMVNVPEPPVLEMARSPLAPVFVTLKLPVLDLLTVRAPVLVELIVRPPALAECRRTGEVEALLGCIVSVAEYTGT